MSFKRCLVLGVGAWRTTFVSNVVLGFVWLAILPLDEGGWDPAAIWPGLILSLTFLGGQVFTFLSLEKGDVSVATPALGSKVVIVALISGPLLGEPPTLPIWIAAMITLLGIVLLQGGPVTNRRALVLSILLGIISAAFFALTDVLVQKWCIEIGFTDLMPVMGVGLAVFSLGLIPMFNGKLSEIRGEQLGWVGWGAGLIALQALLMSIALGVFGEATSVNVVYSSRAIWSVLLVWYIGHWFANRERHVGGAVMGRRLGGSTLILLAIILVVTC